MKALKHFLVFGTVVAAVVVLTQSALGATRVAAAKPVARVATFQPERHSAMVVSPARLRVQSTALGRVRVAGNSPLVLRRVASPLIARRIAGSSALDRRR